MDSLSLQSSATPPAGQAKAGRCRVLHIAFACDPETSMEMRIGWNRALIAAQQYDVVVLCGPGTRLSVLNAEAKKLGLADHLQFIEVTGSSISRMLSRTATTYYMGYRLWHKAAYQQAKKLHAKNPFDLVHQTTFCGFREPGECWKLDAPFVWGPVGGTQSFPLRFLTQLSPQAAWIELCRNAINFWQLRYCRKVRGAAKKSSALISATQRAHDDLLRAQNLESEIQLETALDFPVADARATREPNQPINLLWSGRLRAWKTFPLLIKALAKLPASIDFRLRVLGTGDCETQWKRLAQKYGVSDRIEWLGWPEYRDTLPHYRWADAFVFTSMRDTSGTGLQEALAMGTPILGVNHQGAADIMSTSCAIPIPVGSPKETIQALTDGIKKLVDSPLFWKQLSDGAIEKAKHMTWAQQIEPTHAWYQKTLQDASLAASRTTFAELNNRSTKDKTTLTTGSSTTGNCFDSSLDTQSHALKGI